MSIIVTIEELKAYESALFHWSLKRIESYEKILKDGDTKTCILKWQQSMNEWIKENPAPKLIPSV